MPTAPATERAAWSDLRGSLDWRPGEHVTVLGPTGSGKSYLALDLLGLRRYVLALATKPKDSTLGPLVARGGGYRRIRSWPPPVPSRYAPRLVLWPRSRSLDSLRDDQAEAFRVALNGIWLDGGWCLYVDELHYMANTLGQGERLRILWQQGRSSGISIVACSQRPAHVPLEAYSQATHLFIFRTRDQRDQKRLGDIGNVDPKWLAAVVADLERFEFAYVDSRTGSVVVSRVA